MRNAYPAAVESTSWRDEANRISQSPERIIHLKWEQTAMSAAHSEWVPCNWHRMYGIDVRIHVAGTEAQGVLIGINTIGFVNIVGKI